MTILDLDELLRLLTSTYDMGVWWPSESPFEVMVGAILTQQTNWTSVSRALVSLRAAGLLSVDAMADCDLAELEMMVRPTGFYRQKASRLRAMARYIKDRYASDVESFLGRRTDEVRKELLSLPGIGNETADSILLFGGGHPKFVAAAYVGRVLDRTGIFSSSDYMELQRFVESHIEPDARTYRELYALCVHLCQNACLRTPSCGECPVSSRCTFNLRRG